MQDETVVGGTADRPGPHVPGPRPPAALAAMLLAAPADASAVHLAAAWASWPTVSRRPWSGGVRADPDPDDRFRGLYVSDAQVDQLLGGGLGPLLGPEADPEAAARLAAVEAEADAAEAAGADVRLRRLVRSFELEPLDVELLLVALAPDLDPRFERLYGYLHDDVSRRRASVGLALELSGVGEGSGPGRARLGPPGAARRRRAARRGGRGPTRS